jgi:hypothetical protein
MKTDRRSIDSFLDFLTESVPFKEPSPFFASRVANLAELERTTFFAQLTLVARLAFPLLASFAFAAILLSYSATSSDPFVNSYDELFLEQEEQIEPVTVEDVLLALGPSDSNGGSFENPR